MRIRPVLVVLVLSTLSPVLSSVVAESVHEGVVSFGIARREIAPGLEVAAACSVAVSHGGLDLRDGGTDETFLSMAPGPCAITVYVLGVPIALPIVNATPIGRTSYSIPGVGGLTFGLADVSIDLLVSVHTHLAKPVEGLAASAAEASWTRWGATSLSVSANLGSRGSTMHVGLPFNVTMNLSVGASVYALGIRLFSVDLASLGAVTGSPSLVVPVSVDLKPSNVTASAWARTPTAIQVNWTRNADDDFEAYRIRVAPQGRPEMIIVVEDPTALSAEIPAWPSTDFGIEVSVVDQSGQVSEINSVGVRTPAEPVQAPPSQEGILGFIALSGIIGFGLGLLVPRRRRKGGN